MRWFRLIIEIICYLGALFALSGIVALSYTIASGLCPRFDTGMISCKTPFAKSVADYAMGVTLVTAFTGIPLLFLLGAIGFVIWRLLRRSDARKKARREALAKSASA